LQASDAAFLPGGRKQSGRLGHQRRRRAHGIVLRAAVRRVCLCSGRLGRPKRRRRLERCLGRKKSSYNGDRECHPGRHTVAWCGVSQLDMAMAARWSFWQLEGNADYDDIRPLMTTLGGNGSGTVYLSFVSPKSPTQPGAESSWSRTASTSLFLGSCWEGANWGWGGRAAPVATTSVSPFTYSLLVYRFDLHAHQHHRSDFM
jgi:hypothetical protein